MAKKKKSQKVDVFEEFAKIRGNPTAFLLINFIDLSDAVVFEQEIRGKKFTELDIVLHSPGGNPHAAYQLITIARDHASSVNVCVPYFAKSAATLFCLGADSITLSEAAELGPLDTQVRERVTAGKYRWNSALNLSKTID